MVTLMSNEKFDKLKESLAVYLVYHEKAVNHEILHTMQIPANYISEKYPEEILAYKQLLDNEYGIGAAELVHCKECVYRGQQECVCTPYYPDDEFYCAKGDTQL